MKTFKIWVKLIAAALFAGSSILSSLLDRDSLERIPMMSSSLLIQSAAWIMKSTLPRWAPVTFMNEVAKSVSPAITSREGLASAGMSGSWEPSSCSGFGLPANHEGKVPVRLTPSIFAPVVESASLLNIMGSSGLV